MFGLYLRCLRKEVARLAFVIFIGASLASVLGLMYPVQRELDTSMYSRATYAAVINGIFPVEDEAQLGETVGAPTCLVSSWTTAVGSVDSAPQLTHVQVVGPDCDASAFPFPSETVVSGPSVAAGDWIDISADLAQALHASIGDKVTVQVRQGLPTIQLTVRSIAAVREPGWQFVAVAPGARLMRELPAGAQKYGTMLTAAPGPEALARIEGNLVSAKLKKTKFYPPEAHSVNELAREAEEQSASSLGLVRTIGALAIIAISFLVGREMHVFRGKAQEVLQLVHVFGGDVAAAARIVHLVAFVTGGIAIAAAFAVAWSGFEGGVFACCFPPALNGLAIDSYLGLMVILACVGVLSYAALVRRVRG